MNLVRLAQVQAQGRLVPSALSGPNISAWWLPCVSNMAPELSINCPEETSAVTNMECLILCDTGQVMRSDGSITWTCDKKYNRVARREVS